MFMSVHDTMNVGKVIYKCREPIYFLPVSNLCSILTLSLVEHELLTLPEHLSSPPVFSWVRVTDLQFYMYVLQIVVCPLFIFLWPLYCLFFFNIRILITPLVSSNSSNTTETRMINIPFDQICVSRYHTLRQKR